MTAGRMRLAGIGLLFGSLWVYVLAVDRTWYAVDGLARLAVESHGLLRWRFISHALGLSNGGMREQSWAFVAFPMMFWTAVALVLVGSALVWRARRRDTPPQRALDRLRGRRSSTLAARRRWFGIITSMLGIAAVLAVAGVVTLRSAPSAETLVNAQRTAGNWRARLDTMRDDQRLMMMVNNFGWVRFGEMVSPSEASALVQQDAMKRARAEADAILRCGAAPDPGECRMLHAGAAQTMDRLQALTKPEVAASTATAGGDWRAALASLDLRAIVGLALSIAFVVLLLIVWSLAPRVVAAELRGFDPVVEDALYPRYTPLGRAVVFVAILVATLGIACAGGSLPDGISFGIVACALAGACELLGIGRVLLAPRALARARDPQLAANGAIAAHDRAVLAEVAQVDVSVSAKQQYVSTLQAAASPSDLIANAQTELQQAQYVAAQLRGSVLGPALQAARSRLRAASAQYRALRQQNAPFEAFGAVHDAMRAAKAAIAQLAASAGWSPWPLTPAEAAPEAAQLVSARAVVGAVVLIAIVGGVAVSSRPYDARTDSTAVERAAPVDARCDSILDEYQRALSMAGDSAGALAKAGCAIEGANGTLAPPTRLSTRCQTLWTSHLLNAQRAIDLNARARAACPSMEIPSMGAVPTALRIDPKSVARTSGPLATPGLAAPPSGVGRPRALTIDAVSDLVKAQARSLTGAAAAFGDSFAIDAIAFFPHSLVLYAGREQIVGAAREAWGPRGAPDHGESSDVLVGLLPDFAWATAQWKITLADRQTVVSVRVTEIIAQDATGLRVVAASFSVPPPAGSTGIGEPAPAIVSGAPPAREPDTWLASLLELAHHVRNDDATTLIGSGVKEFALGADESRKMLAGWKNVKLEFVGNVHAIEGAGYRIVVAYARWRGSKPTLFRVFALFVPGEAMVGPAPWELATAQYSVAVPASEPQIATAVATAPESPCTIAALACDRFSTNGQTGKKLHALVFAAEQAGRHAEAICLARSNLTSSDKWLVGAANFDTSRAWDGLGCHAQAIAAIEASLAVRPHDQGGWKETCDQCRKIGAACAACDDSQRLARSNSTAATVDRGETGSNTSDPPPMWVSLVQDPPRVFEVWEAGKKVMDGPGGIQVAPGHPRTIVIKGQGWKDKTLIVDGRNERVEFKLELASDCKSTLADPKSADCRAQFCEGHADDARCHSE